MAKIGDIVRYLNAVGGGKITRIDGATAYVEEDGFETPVLLRECVVVAAADAAKPSVPAPKPAPAAKPATSQAPSQTPAPTQAPAPFVETPEGEKLNIVLAYEPADRKRLSSTAYDTYLVNDSNYDMMVAYLTKGDEDNGWTTRWTGVIEAGIQEFLCEVEAADLAHMDRIAVQYIAYKPHRECELKPAQCIERKLDTTKFFKLHCFQPNPYFDEPVLALTIASDDVPQRPFEPSTVEIGKVAPKEADRKHKPAKAHAQRINLNEPLVIDLHIDQLVDTTAGLSNSDMLNLQVDKFREVMDANLQHHGRKIVFIHGKGEGVLRKALLKELNYRYKGHDVQDASFREYGFGATQVKIK